MRLLLVLAALLAACGAWWLLFAPGAGDGLGAPTERARVEVGDEATGLAVTSDSPGASRPSLVGVTGARGGGGAATSDFESAGDRGARASAPDVAPAAPPLRVAGVVRDAQGQPVAGAEVSAPGLETRATTDGSGRFELELPPPGVFALVARRPGGADEQLQVALDRAPAIVGRVVDARTRGPLAGVRVEARPSASAFGTRPAAQATTDADGGFELLVPETGEHDLRALALGPSREDAPEGHREGRIARVRPAGPSAPVEIALERALTIEGQLVDEGGEPLPALAWLTAIGLAPDGTLDYTRVIQGRGVAGALRVAGLSEGRYQLTVFPPFDGSGDALLFAATTVESVEAGTRGLEVRVARGAWLQGRVVGPDGEALGGRGGFVQAVRPGEAVWRSTTRGPIWGDGRWRLGPLAALERMDVHVVHVRGYRPEVVRDVDPRTRDLEIRLTPGGSIRGRVVLSGGRAAPPGVSVGLQAVGLDVRSPGARLFVMTAADGTFEADGLLDAPYDLEAGGGTSGYLGVTAHAVAPGTDGVALRVVEGVDLAGTLLDAHGQPVPAQSLQADDGKHIIAMRPYVQVGPDGLFRLRGLAPGKVRLGFQRGERWIALGEFTAPATDLRVTVPE